MLYRLSSVVLVLAAAAVASAQNVTATSFDLYLLAQSWQPQFCYGTKYPGCDYPQTFWKTHFTLHGLWPQYGSGGYPSSCTKEAFDKTIPDKIGWSTMTTYWPNVKEPETSSKYDDFWDHEWSKHGTCSNLSQYDYFDQSIKTLKLQGTPAVIQNNVGKDVAKVDIQNGFGGKNWVSLQCSSGKYLSEARTCWAKDANNKPTKQIECPSSITKADTCSSSTLHIEAF